MRCFAAIDVPETIKQNIVRLQESMPEKGVKRTPEENMHFTMKFFGECNNDDINYIKQKTFEISEKSRQFCVNIENIGSFPSPSFIRIIWIGCPALSGFMNSFQDEFSQKFGKEEAVPHLTIARAAKDADFAALRMFVKENEGFNAGSMNISEVKIKNSTLCSNSTVYKDIFVFRLSP